jgi:hypothetical protein
MTPVRRCWHHFLETGCANENTAPAPIPTGHGIGTAGGERAGDSRGRRIWRISVVPQGCCHRLLPGRGQGTSPETSLRKTRVVRCSQPVTNALMQSARNPITPLKLGFKRRSEAGMSRQPARVVSILLNRARGPSDVTVWHPPFQGPALRPHTKLHRA